jgi:hypothetical protein
MAGGMFWGAVVHPGQPAHPHMMPMSSSTTMQMGASSMPMQMGTSSMEHMPMEMPLFPHASSTWMSSSTPRWQGEVSTTWRMSSSSRNTTMPVMPPPIQSKGFFGRIFGAF